MDFGKIIKRILLDKDMTQTQLADSLDMSKQSLNSFLSRKDHRINSDIIPMCDKLGYDVEIIFRDRQSGKTISAD